MQGDTIFWNPIEAFNVITYNGFVRAESPALGLLHELYHWYLDHTHGNQAWDEYVATKFENEAARVLDEPVRESYFSVYRQHMFMTVNNPTAKASHGYWQAVDESGKRIGGEVYDPDKPTAIVIGTSPENGGPGESGGGGSGDGGASVPDSGSGSGEIKLPDYVPSPAPNPGHTGGGYWQWPAFTSPAPSEQSEVFFSANSASVKHDPYIEIMESVDHSVGIVGVAEAYQMG